MPTLFLDVETTSGDESIMAVNPWDHCGLLGFSYAIDDAEPTYVDYLHRSDKEPIAAFVQQLVDYCDTWVNHNIKFDMHVLTNTLGIKLDPDHKYICTLTASKLYDSDRQENALDVLSWDYCQYDIRHHEPILKRYTKNGRIKDYAVIPTDVMAEYANDDIRAVRKVYEFLLKSIPERSHEVWTTEIALTYELYALEQEGMPTTEPVLQRAQIKSLVTMLNQQQILDKAIGWTINPTSEKDLFEVLIGKYQLPIQDWTDAGNPSFDVHALRKYAALDNAPVEVIEAVMAYRKASTFNSLFVTDWLKRLRDGRLHPTYNQVVRTGRMSCSAPNAQQLSEEAKELIIPPPGWSIWSMDQSQIEFRFIAHYTQQPEVITAYIANPDTDFHVWVAEMCRIARKQAKNVNFGMAFGEGERKLTLQLATDKAMIEWASQNGIRPENYKEAMARRATEIMTEYHRTMYRLKPTSRAAANALKSKGFIWNWYGRCRKMPVYLHFDGQRRDMSYKAFNNLNQSSAADLMKERTVAFCRAVRGTQIKVLGQVHDELFGMAPTEVAEDPRMIRDALSIMEHPTRPLTTSLGTIPIRCTYGSSRNSWKEANKTACVHQYERKLEGLFDWARG